MNKSKKLFNNTQKVKQRRLRTIERLEEQLKFGHKKPKGKDFSLELSPLEEKDVKRIKQELLTLKSRV